MTLTYEYLESIWTGVCPVFSVTLTRGNRKLDTNAELDRIDPDLGYVPGNVVFLSARANLVKSNGTAVEHRTIADWMESLPGASS